VIKHLALDERGGVTFAGATIARELPVVNAWQRTIGYDRQYTGPADEAFIGILAPSGTALEFLTYLGGKGNDYANGLAIDSAGTAYVVGWTASSDFPLRRPLEGYPTDDNGNAFLVKFAPAKPPAIGSAVAVEKPGKPLQIKLTGTNLQPGLAIYIGEDEQPWPLVKAKGTSAVLKGEGLAERFPVGVPVTIRVINPDGGGSFYTVTR
jgi:hypothetical protein